MTVAGIGHNNGPTMETGHSWRKHVWTKARADLMPNLPIEVLRLRVNRAAALGLPYKTYASVRASTGRDVIGFLFSTNALEVLRATDRLDPKKGAKIASLHQCDRTALVYPVVNASDLVPPCDAACAAPAPQLSWSDMSRHVKAVIQSRGNPSDGYVVIGETSAERDWSEAAKTAGFLTGQRFFDARS